MLHSVYDEPDGACVQARYDRLLEVVHDGLPGGRRGFGRARSHPDEARPERMCWLVLSVGRCSVRSPRPDGPGLRTVQTTLIAMRVTERLGVDRRATTEVHHAPLLRHAGCTTEVHEARRSSAVP